MSLVAQLAPNGISNGDIQGSNPPPPNYRIIKNEQICLMWTLWRETNNQILMGWRVQLSREYWFVRSLFEWSHCMGISDRKSIVDFTDSLSFRV